MCGINMFLNYERGEAAIQRMMEATVHRGADHSAWLKMTDRIFIAGNRLKTHDLETVGNPLIVLEDGTAALIWNGALSNDDELRNHLLSQGVLFTSRADAEVLLHWLRIYGEQGIKQLEGMFSL